MYMYSFVHLYTLMHLEGSHMYFFVSKCDVCYMFCTCACIHQMDEAQIFLTIPLLHN